MHCMKCGSILDSIGEDQMIGKYIVLCPRDALYEKNIPDTRDDEDSN